MPNTSYTQSVALKALEYPEWETPARWVDWHNDGNWSFHADWETRGRDDIPAIAATNVIDAILWVLGSEAWHKAFGPEWRLLIGPDSYEAVTLGTNVGEADTPSDLLDAMLAAVKEAS